MLASFRKEISHQHKDEQLASFDGRRIEICLFSENAQLLGTPAERVSNPPNPLPRRFNRQSHNRLFFHAIV
jgi:hypothetical protein